MQQLTDFALPEKLPRWGVLMLESHHSPKFSMGWRTHSFIKFVYVLRGEGDFLFRDATSRFCAGDVVVVPPGKQNRIVDDPTSACSLYVCCIATELLGFDDQILRRLETRCISGDGHFSTRVAALMRRMVHEQDRGGTDRSVSMVIDALRLVQITLEQSGDLRRERKSKLPGSTRQSDRDVLERYVASLKTDFFEATTIDEAANRLAMPRRTFTKLFVEHVGETWLSHVRRLAIEHAKHRLVESDLPIVSIAFECGFNDLSTFYRQFKSQTQLSPAAYRDAAR